MTVINKLFILATVLLAIMAAADIYIHLNSSQTDSSSGRNHAMAGLAATEGRLKTSLAMQNGGLVFYRDSSGRVTGSRARVENMTYYRDSKGRVIATELLSTNSAIQD